MNYEVRRRFHEQDRRGQRIALFRSEADAVNFVERCCRAHNADEFRVLPIRRRQPDQGPKPPSDGSNVVPLSAR